MTSAGIQTRDDSKREGADLSYKPLGPLEQFRYKYSGLAIRLPTWLYNYEFGSELYDACDPPSTSVCTDTARLEVSDPFLWAVSSSTGFGTVKFIVYELED